MVDSQESEQTGRFRWREAFNGYYVDDTLTGEARGMGDGVDIFCEDPTEWKAERITTSSNIFGNLRSRPEFRSGNWQQNGIAKVVVQVLQMV